VGSHAGDFGASSSRLPIGNLLEIPANFQVPASLNSRSSCVRYSCAMEADGNLCAPAVAFRCMPADFGTKGLQVYLKADSAIEDGSSLEKEGLPVQARVRLSKGQGASGSPRPPLKPPTVTMLSDTDRYCRADTQASRFTCLQQKQSPPRALSRPLTRSKRPRQERPRAVLSR
jgi:hypothetical protein